jgi:hypothetical protein
LAIVTYPRTRATEGVRQQTTLVCASVLSPERANRRRAGEPDPTRISTSHVERLNLTTRMSVRRFTRLTNAFSKKVENHTAAVALHFAYYNYCRAHQSLGAKTTPAMAAGVTDHVWTLDELIGLLEAAEATPIPARPVRAWYFKLTHYRAACRRTRQQVRRPC